MRKGLFILLLISFLCLYLLPFCLSETNFTNKADDHYKQLKQGRPRKDLQGSEQKDVEAAAEVIMRAKRGVYGSGNDILRGRKKNGANPLRIKSTSLLLWKVSCGLFSFGLLTSF